MSGKLPFEVIEGGRGVKPKRKARPRVRSQHFWECRTCLTDIGVTTRSLMKAKFGPMEDGQLRISGGRDVWICVHCLSRGKVTYSDR